MQHFQLLTEAYSSIAKLGSMVDFLFYDEGVIWDRSAGTGTTSLQAKIATKRATLQRPDQRSPLRWRWSVHFAADREPHGRHQGETWGVASWSCPALA